MIKALYCFLIFTILPVSVLFSFPFQQINDEDSIQMAKYYTDSREFLDTDPEKSLELGQKCLDLATSTSHQSNKAMALENMGRIYFNIGNYGKTLEYFFQVLQMAVENEDRYNEAVTLNNIGIVYHENLQLDKALEYYQKSLHIKEELGDQRAISHTLTNVGLIHDEMGEHVQALEAYRKSLKMDLALEDAGGIFINYNNIGQSYLKQGLHDSALVYFNRSWQIGQKLDNDYDKAHVLNNIAEVNQAKGQFDEAEEKYLNALELAKQIDAKLRVKESYKGLSDVYGSKNQYEKSLRYYRLYEYLKDSLFNEDKLQRMQELETDYRLKRKQVELNLLKKEEEIYDLKQSQSRLVAYLLISCLFLFGTLVIVLYNRNQFKIKANKDLENKNQEILSKNMDIMDSLSYAKSIQESFLPDTSIITRFFSEYFVYYKARDVINGDFYWFEDKEDFLILAVVDCTGHGVPGALITVMGNSLLNQVVNEKRILEPAEILSELNYGIFDTLNQGNFNMKNNDGMDIAICRFDKGSKKLTFSGAKRPLYYFKNNQFHAIKGDSHSVGGMFYQKNRSYKEHEVYLNENDAIYIFSDGILDQFGGENDKKFLPSRFKDILHEVQGENMQNQKAYLDRKFRMWKGENEQTDDILVMGLLI